MLQGSGDCWAELSGFCFETLLQMNYRCRMCKAFVGLPVAWLRTIMVSNFKIWDLLTYTRYRCLWDLISKGSMNKMDSACFRNTTTHFWIRGNSTPMYSHVSPIFRDQNTEQTPNWMPAKKAIVYCRTVTLILECNIKLDINIINWKKKHYCSKLWGQYFFMKWMLILNWWSIVTVKTFTM